MAVRNGETELGRDTKTDQTTFCCWRHPLASMRPRCQLNHATRDWTPGLWQGNMGGSGWCHRLQSEAQRWGFRLHRSQLSVQTFKMRPQRGAQSLWAQENCRLHFSFSNWSLISRQLASGDTIHFIERGDFEIIHSDFVIVVAGVKTAMCGPGTQFKR